MSMPIKSARRLPDGTSALTDEIVGLVNGISLTAKRISRLLRNASDHRTDAGHAY